MNASLLDRLDITMAAVLRAGTSRPEGWLVDQLLAPPKAIEAAKNAPPGKAPKPRKMTPERAKQLAADLEGYDGKIVGGRIQ